MRDSTWEEGANQEGQRDKEMERNADIGLRRHKILIVIYGSSINH